MVFWSWARRRRPGSLAEHFAPVEGQSNIYVRKAAPVPAGFESPSHVVPFPGVYGRGASGHACIENIRGWPSRPAAEAGGAFVAGPVCAARGGGRRQVPHRRVPWRRGALSCSRYGRSRIGSVPDASRRHWLCTCARRWKRRGRRTWASVWRVFRSSAAVRRPSQWPLRRSRWLVWGGTS